MGTSSAVARLLESLTGGHAARERAWFDGLLAERGLAREPATIDTGAILAVVYPALRPWIARHPEDVEALVRGRLSLPRDARHYRRAAAEALVGEGALPDVGRGLRRLAQREKLRVAARELLVPSASVDVTARELSDLADTCIDGALAEALAWAEARWGAPVTTAGAPCRVTVLGMGKLGGRELNPGSDVDLVVFYETDDGFVRGEGGAPVEQTLFEHFTRVVRRMTATLEEPTEDGFVWRVDLRLRPEGSRGPLVNALAAAERYYETWGRTWERAAMLRARPVAGDLELGRLALEQLAPFVWRRAVDPRIPAEMGQLLVRARAELSDDPARDLKLGPGGIREAEFFVQSLQLVWGGKEPQVRAVGTLGALRRLRARGLVTDREAREIGDAYLVLRRLEHRVQFASGLQTHALPGGEGLERFARGLGWGASHDFERDLERTRRRVQQRFASLTRGVVPDEAREDVERLLAALDDQGEDGVRAALPAAFGDAPSPDLARHLAFLARRPDMPLGGKTRDEHPELSASLLDALADAADPEQAARLLGTFFARLTTPGIYVRAMAEDVNVLRRLVGLFGTSAFLGEALVGRPALFESLLFVRQVPDAASARRAVEEEVRALDAPDGVPHELDPSERLVGALRRAKSRVTMEVGLSDLAGEMGPREVSATLTALADATLEQALRAALAERGLAGGLAVVALGKLGGRELGYGSDLDLIFVYDGDDGDDGDDARFDAYVRAAQRVLRLVQMPHGGGPGYELDTRLRPSGSQGLLVVSLGAFARYHGVAASAAPASGERGEARAEDWERQALVRARVAAGDPGLAARVEAIARKVTYERGAPDLVRLRHLRERMEAELGRERREPPRRLDLKVGAGGLVDVEFAVQFLQMRHGADPRVRTTETEVALGALEACGYLDPLTASALREGWTTLRRIEQALRVVTGTSSHRLEEGAPALFPLARRLGYRSGPSRRAEDALLEHYLAVTRDVRAAYLAVLDGGPPPSRAEPASLALGLGPCGLPGGWGSGRSRSVPSRPPRSPAAPPPAPWRSVRRGRRASRSPPSSLPRRATSSWTRRPRPRPRGSGCTSSTARASSARSSTACGTSSAAAR